MQSAHFFICCGMLVLIVGFGVLAWCVRRMWVGQKLQSTVSDRIIAEKKLEYESLVKYVQNFGSHSIQQANENTAKLCSELSKRLVDLETENKITPPKKRDDDDDPFVGSRSWAAQAAAAERGERSIA